MKRSEQDRLLQEILAGDDAPDLRQASLDHGLRFIRQQRRRRRLARAGVLVVAPLLVFLSILVVGSRKEPSRPDAALPAPSHQSSAPPASTGGVKFITDDELLALFPNRAVALIGRPGEQQLVFLDRAGATPGH